MKTLVSICVLFLSLQSHAWYERLNGGFAVICPQHAPQTLDLFEMQNRYGLHLDANHLSSVGDRVRYLISKVEKLNPRRAAIYKQWFAEFAKESERIPDAKFNEVVDVGSVNIPAECALRQVIYQREPGPLNKFRYTIDKTLWDQLSTAEQAAFVMHELIYRELSQPAAPQKTSETTRHLNGLLNSTEFLTMSLADYLKNLQELHVVNAEDDGIEILLSVYDKANELWRKMPLQFNSKGQATTMTLSAEASFVRGSFTIEPRCSEKTSAPVLESLGVLRLDDAGELISITPATEAEASPALHRCDGLLHFSEGHLLLARSWSFKNHELERAQGSLAQGQSYIIWSLNGDQYVSLEGNQHGFSYEVFREDKTGHLNLRAEATACTSGPYGLDLASAPGQPLLVDLAMLMPRLPSFPQCNPHTPSQRYGEGHPSM
jgi:hypothetical protein